MEISVIATPGIQRAASAFCRAKISLRATPCFSRRRPHGLSTGNAAQLIRSIKEKLFTLSGDRRVFPGHEEETTLAHEKQYNPFIR
ncbi:MAG: hypothetical protein ACLRTQ_05065 [Candidatus Borkfalkia sp.]